MLFLCGVQVVLKSGVQTVLELIRWMSRRGLLRSLGRCCLGLVALLVAGGAAGMLPVPLNCPLPLRITHPPTLVCCFCVFAAVGVTSTISGRLEVNLSLSDKRGGKSHLGTILLSAVSGIWRFCMVIRPCLLYGYISGFVFSFPCLLLQASGCCRRDSPQGLLI